MPHPDQVHAFWAKVAFTQADCWEWRGSKSPKGYGAFHLRAPISRGVGAHRLAWEYMNGPIPHGLQIDHLCRNPGCVRPDHLEVVTQQENRRRGYTNGPKLKRCKHGHEFTPENTFIDRRDGGKRCRTCRRASHKRALDLTIPSSPLRPNRTPAKVRAALLAHNATADP